jgi:hypothetical protein
MPADGMIAAAQKGSSAHPCGQLHYQASAPSRQCEGGYSSLLYLEQTSAFCRRLPVDGWLSVTSAFSLRANGVIE